MNYAKLNTHDIANGPGVRVSLFVSGCRHRCKGCFNAEAWDFNYGREFEFKTALELDNALDEPFISGLSILGGEPLEPENIEIVTAICEMVHQFHPEQTIWLYTGSLYEDVKDLKIMKYIDVLVDGEFVEELKDITLRFRGSKNQRIIDVKKSRKTNSVVLWEE